MKTLFFMTLYGSAMILLIIFLRRLLKHSLSKRTFKMLWIIVAFRLLVPFFTVREIDVHDKFSYPVTEYIIAENQKLPPVQNTEINFTTKSTASDISTNYKVSLSKIIFTVWIFGTGITMSVFAALYFVGIKKYRSAVPVYNPEISKIINEFPVRKKVKIKISDKFFSPLTYGIINPVILLPERITDYDSEQIKYAVYHELIHIKNDDLLWKLLVIFALCLHWFNPMVWIMFLLFSRDIELSCDEEVIKHGADKEKYALTLISFKEKGHSAVLSNAFGKNAVSERIESIMKFKKSTTAAVLISSGIVLGTAVIFSSALEFKASGEQSPDEIIPAEMKQISAVSASDHPDKKVSIHLGKYGERVSVEYVDWDYEDTIGNPSAPSVYEEEEKKETVTFENGLEITLPPKANYGVIKTVPEEEYAYGEDAVKILADMFSGEDDFTYPIDSKYDDLYHYYGGFRVTAAKGENIYSMTGGTVIYADMAGFPFGNAVIIDHGNGNVCIYAHCNDLCVSAGDEVKAGDVIGHVGNTGEVPYYKSELYIYRYH